MTYHPTNTTNDTREIDIFLTPGSRILTPLAVEQPCLPMLPQKWRSKWEVVLEVGVGSC